MTGKGVDLGSSIGKEIARHSAVVAPTAFGAESHKSACGTGTLHAESNVVAGIRFRLLRAVAAHASFAGMATRRTSRQLPDIGQGGCAMMNAAAATCRRSMHTW
jgi:hypothetical protein